MLKNTYLLFFIAAILCSCTNDDIDSPDHIDVSVQGAWKLTELNIETPLDINDDSIFNTNLLDETGIIDAVLTFEADNTGTIFYRSWIGFNSKEKDGKLIFLVNSSLSSDHAPELFSYNIENDKVLINTDITFNKGYTELSQLTYVDDELHLLIPNGLIVTDENTSEESVNEDLTYVFSRQ